ncbi:MAG: Hsp70 family protein, partial [Dehalococcoidales bacterium]
PQVEVSFDIDANGILSVKAHDKGTGKEQKITITASSGLSKDEVEKMQHQAEEHASEDARQREEVEIRNAADTMAYTAEKTLRDNKDKISEELNKEVEEKVAAVRSVQQGNDIEAIRKASQELSEAMQKVGEAVYSQQPPEDGEAPPEDGDDEDTVEGEFKEV